jgi:hypothetical protein
MGRVADRSDISPHLNTEVKRKDGEQIQQLDKDGKAGA